MHTSSPQGSWSCWACTHSGTSYHLGDACRRIMLEELVAAALAEGNNEVSFKLVLVRGP